MIKTKLILAVTLTFILFSFTGNKAAYKIYNEKGGKSSYKKIVKEAEKADIIFFVKIRQELSNC